MYTHNSIKRAHTDSIFSACGRVYFVYSRMHRSGIACMLSWYGFVRISWRWNSTVLLFLGEPYSKLMRSLHCMTICHLFRYVACHHHSQQPLEVYAQKERLAPINFRQFFERQDKTESCDSIPNANVTFASRTKKKTRRLILIGIACYFMWHWWQFNWKYHPEMCVFVKWN